jgi:hypothetical protein
LSGWSVIQGLVDGTPTLVRAPLWLEIRRALAERASALEHILGRGGLDLEALKVEARDDIGKINLYRNAAAGLFDGLFDGAWNAPEMPWAKEVAAVNANAETGAPRYKMAGASAGNLLNVFTEAGLENPTWTRSVPCPTHRDVWMDFYDTLNLATLVGIPSTAAVASGKENGHSYGRLSWSWCRSESWLTIHNPGISPGANLITVGRMGVGYRNLDLTYDALVAYISHSDITLDLSVLRQVKHLEADDSETACDPVRLVFYLTLGKPDRYYEPDIYTVADLPIVIKLSGDAGATWETLATSTWIDEDLILKLESSDTTRWTANSILRVETTVAKGADTPTWPAPSVGEENCYIEGGGSLSLFAFAEFDWAFRD